MAIENIGLYPIEVDVYRKHRETTVRANDNDTNSRGLLIKLVKDGVAIDSTGINLKIGFRNAIGEERLYDCDIVDALTGQYKVFYPTEMLVGNGGRVVKLEIKAYESSGALLNYSPLFVYVDTSEIPDEAMEGTNEETSLTKALSEVLAIDEKFSSVNSQLVDIAKNVRQYGIKGDGTDETLKIQDVLDMGGKIYFPEGTYVFDRLYLTKDNTIINFAKDVILKSAYAGESLSVGAFEILGQNIFTQNITQNIVKDTKEVFVFDSSAFVVGDFIKITQTNPSGTDFESKLKQNLNFVGTIAKIDVPTHKLTLNESIPHDYQVENSITITKMKPVKNVQLIGENIVFDKMGTTAYANHFVVNNAYKVKISGFHFVNGGGKGITFYNTYDFIADAVKHSKPTNVSSGHGYGVQVTSGSCFGLISNSLFYDSRHAIDFALAANNILVDNCSCFNANIGGHGQNSKYITIKNTRVEGAGLSLGNFTFGSDSDYKFVNCKVNNLLGEAFNVANQSFNVSIENCVIMDCKTALLVTGGNSIDVQGLKIKYTYNDPFVLMNGCYDINLYGVILKSSRISTDGCCIKILDDSYNINIVNSNLTFSRKFGISIQNSLNFNSRIKISNSKINNVSSYTTTKTSIESANPGVTVDNCDLYSRVILSSANGSYKFTNNNLYDIPIVINATKNTMITNNFGTSTTWTVPTDNGNDLIVKDNIVTFV